MIEEHQFEPWTGHRFLPSVKNLKRVGQNLAAALCSLAVLGQALAQDTSAPTYPSAVQEVLSAPQAVLNYQDRRAIFEPQRARYGMVASDHHLASQVGAEVLRQGGNAVDAAVATAFALAVVLPYAGNLGGGGFAMIHKSRDNSDFALDFREAAPSLAHQNLFLDERGEVVRGMSIESTASVAVPGSVAGLLTMLEEHGTFSRRQVIQPAIELANSGFEVSPTLASLLQSHAAHLYKSPANRTVFFKRKAGSTCEPSLCSLDDLQPLEAGDSLVQKDLARTLERIAQFGREGFYDGPVAQAIVNTVNHDVPRMTLQDMQNYRVRWRTPVSGHYRGLKIVSMPPPSSGGVHLVQMLNILSQFPMSEYGYGSAMSLHLMAEAARRAYHDRARHLGDPDFVDVPVTDLTSIEYARTLASGISLKEAGQSNKLQPVAFPRAESTETTHLSVVDRWHNMVSLTTTLNLNFGSGWMAEGTGVLLNNEMDDFSVKPGQANAFGLLGSHANRVEPGKRPLSSMTPTLVFKDGKPYFATGTPGGSRIITMVMQVIVNVADFGMNIASASAVPRMHHQWNPDRIDLEQGFSPDTIRILQAAGHKVEPSRAAGRVQTVGIGDNEFLGYCDPRSADGAATGVN